jgi:DNA mismatch repair protein MutL
MSQIKILPPDLQNKIAAGEVIERPASVVKELIENAIDAESTEIKIDILSGGKQLIRVSDNGFGMDREDALLCFEKYATSKLRGENDLFNIKTMGFRGEALSSIAAVSKMKLISGRKGSSFGVSVETIGGEIKEVKDSPFIGTSVEMRDLFFNTPARKKFLKSHKTEMFHIFETVTKEALSHWAIGFRLTSGNKDVLVLPLSSDQKERILQIYGEELLDSLMEVQHEGKGIALTSYVSKGTSFRERKSQQHIFINKRPIKDTSLSHAVYRAYEGILPRNKHPIFFLFLTLDPQKVDFNVHPTKREVRFEDKEAIYHFVYIAIRKAIKGERSAYAKQFTEASVSAPFTPRETYYKSQPFRESGTVAAEPLEFLYKAYQPFLYLGETFVAISGKGGLTLIDYHAAHERILYEKLLKSTGLHAHQLLFPRQVKLSQNEHSVILDNIATLKDFGIDIEDFGQSTLIVRSLPDSLKESDMRGILSDVASCLIEGIRPDKSLRETLAAKIACHSSLRGKTVMNKEMVTDLVTKLEQADQPDQCPHGRPTRIFLSTDDLKKMFKRK